MRWPAPLVISPGGEKNVPTLLGLGDPPFSEDQLQEIIASYPHLLPVEHFDPVFGPAVLVGREVRTGSGPIDNLYISPNGYLTLVETKLWKNPEARRQVVAQIIDYCKHLSRWDYQTLDEAYREYSAKIGVQSKSLYSHVCEQCDEAPEESDFVDAVSRCLNQGRFLLLIVGDGIRENVEQMTEYLQQTPNLQFTLGLVEINCYRFGLENESMILIPRIIARTREIERAIVRIEMSSEAEQKVHVTADIPTPVKPGVGSRLTKEEFFELVSKNKGRTSAEKLRQWLEELVGENELLDEHYTPQKLRLKVEVPMADGELIPILNISSDGSITPTPLWNQLSQSGVSSDSFHLYFKELAAIDGRLTHEKVAGGRLVVRKSNPCDLETFLENRTRIGSAIGELVKSVESQV